ncbi:MAG: selenocysteine-specific translation elongation factor [Spirochaetota bacterium]
MYIIGTSGHIDHGKTSLVKALTGIDCDRLPEEKEREMTIDIGFAQISYPSFGTVSIVDVPGHERFIRNMTAGAWGIDLALLVIAADDGWMPQTEDHFRVLELLDIERLIIVLNKIDIVDQDLIELVEDDIRVKLKNTKFENSDFVKVSAKTGAGIPDLKKKILENLVKLHKAANTGKPYLYVDRVFESKGLGTIITGTLKNGFLSENDEVIIYPGEIQARIKKIESHYHDLKKGHPSQRTALNLHGVSVDEMKRGHIIVKQNFFTESNDIIARVKLLEKQREIKNNLGIEILIGTSSIKGKLIFLNDIDIGANHEIEFPVRIKLDDKWFFYYGEPFILTNPGGHRIIGGGKIILPDYIPAKHKKELQNCIKTIKTFSDKELVDFIVKIKLTCTIQELKSKLPFADNTISDIIEEMSKAGSITLINENIFETNYYNNATKKIIEIIKNNAGLNIKELSDIAGLGLNITGIILSVAKNNNAVLEKDGKFFTGEPVAVKPIDNFKKNILQQLKDKGTEGIELDKETDAARRKGLKELIQMNFAANLDGNLVYHSEIYEDLKKKIMGFLDNHDRITIAEARECTSLSRKFLIPLLNKIEHDGLIKRIGDLRFKA